jgi:NAD(P)-dependent dehydrogenase (short-subunit alcohol dehydrogenase family)
VSALEGRVGVAAEALGGRFDFLINNAGVRHQFPFVDCPVDLWRRTIDVNLTGTFICAQAAVRMMLARDGGSIVNLASIAGLTPAGRWGQPEEIAGPAVFLCSDAAAFVHGETLFVDGGWNAAKGY